MCFMGRFLHHLRVFLGLLLLVPGATLAEEVRLEERHRAGDAYVLSLSTTTQTRASSRRPDQPRVDEELELRYDATVVVLEVDASGRPLRERHQAVTASAGRGGSFRPLLPAGASYELRRGAAGDLGLYVEGHRLERPEPALTEALAARFETSRLPSILTPTGPVGIGESWELPPAGLRRLLSDQGLRVIEFDGPALARLLRREGSGPHDRILHYEVPLAWFELAEMPPNAEGSRSEGRLVGSLLFSSTRRGVPVDHRSHLEFSLDGVVTKRRVARPFAWKLHRVRSSRQHARPIASSFSAAY